MLSGLLLYECVLESWHREHEVLESDFRTFFVSGQRSQKIKLAMLKPDFSIWRFTSKVRKFYF